MKYLFRQKNLKKKKKLNKKLLTEQSHNPK